jgi:acyl-CoA-binding protein
VSKALIEIEGFEELQSKLKQLPDKVKRAELLKILGQVANTTVKVMRAEAPESEEPHVARKKTIQPGNLKRSIGKIISKKGRGRENAILYVGPKSKGIKNDGWYGGIVSGGHNVYRKGFKRKVHKAGSSLRYSQEAKSFVPGDPFNERAYDKTKGKASDDAAKKVAAYIQKQIDKLSNV